jgi:multidrug resistance efflux pump
MKSLSVVVGLILLLGGLTYSRSFFQDSGALRLSGVVSANEVIVAAKIDGRITRLAVSEGSRVAQDDLIAELGREEMEPERERLAAAVQQQEAKLTQSREQLRLDRDRARTQLAGAQANLQLAQSQREESRAELGQLQRDFERSSELVKQGLMPRQDAEKAETSLHVAEARIRSLDDRVRVAQNDLELARANERQVAVTAQEVEQIRAQLDQAKAQLAQTTARLGYTAVRAPLPGYVSLRVARQGEVIRQGDPIVTIVDLDDVWVRAEVEESYMNRVLVGQVLPVRLASGEELQGRVTFIAPETEFATQRDVNRTKRDIRTFGIKVALANPEHRLHSGMTAYVMLPATVPAPVAPSARKEPPPPAPAVPASPAAAAPVAPAAVAPAPVPHVPATRKLVPEAAPNRLVAPKTAAAAVPAPARVEAPPALAPAPAVSAPPPSPHAVAGTGVVVPALPVTAPAIGAARPLTGAQGAAAAARPPSEQPMTSIGVAPAPSLPKALVPALPVTAPAMARSPQAPAGVPRLSLEAISVINGKPVAVINKQKLVAGETISGVRVIRILDYEVELEYQGRRFAIGL